MSATEPECPLCGDDPDDPTLHAESCPTVTGELCGITRDGTICLAPEHMPPGFVIFPVDEWRAWQAAWDAGHDLVPLEDAADELARRRG